MEDRDCTTGLRQFVDLAAPLRVLVGVAFIAIVALTIIQVFFRAVLDDPLVWSEEVVRLLLVWVVFLGAAVVTWDGRHLSVDVLFTRLAPGPRRVVRWMNRTVASAFLAVLGWTSIDIVRLNVWDEIGALPISMAWVRVPATVGAVLMLALLLARAWYRVPREPPAVARDDPL